MLQRLRWICGMVLAAEVSRIEGARARPPCLVLLVVFHTHISLLHLCALLNFLHCYSTPPPPQHLSLVCLLTGLDPAGALVSHSLAWEKSHLRVPYLASQTIITSTSSSVVSR